MLNKQDILDYDDLPRVEVKIKQWGNKSVFVKTMTAEQRDEFEQFYATAGFKNIRAQLAVLTVCDDSGHLLFSRDDAPKLGQKSAAALDKIFTAAIKLNAIGKADIEDLEKNSDASL